jgi:hypothetical protein
MELSFFAILYVNVGKVLTWLGLAGISIVIGLVLEFFAVGDSKPSIKAWAVFSIITFILLAISRGLVNGWIRLV